MNGLDLRLALPALCAWAGAGLACGWSVRGGATLAVAAALAATVAAAARRWAAAAATAGVALAAVAAAVHVALVHSGPVPHLARTHRQVSAVMTLVRDPVRRTTASGRGFVLADATVNSVDGRRTRSPVLVLSHAPAWLDLLPGQEVRVAARMQPPRRGDDIAAVVVAGAPRPLGRPPWWQRLAGFVRTRLRVACARLPPDERGLVPGLVDGDTSAMPPSLTDAFRAAGLTHLNAVSGENCAIVLAAAAGLLRRTLLGRGGRIAVLAATLAAFVVVARPSPSVLRAATMGAVALAAMTLGRRSHPVPMLSMAVLLLVLVDPFLARTPGFALSVLATAGIVVAAPRCAAWLSRRLPTPVAVAVAVPLTAQLACTPVLVMVFGQATPWAVVANVLAAPAVAPATLAGIVTACIALASPPVAGLSAALAAVPAWVLAVVARSVAALPGSHAAWPTGWPGAVLLVGLSLPIALLVAGRRLRSNHAMLGMWPP